MARAGPMPFDQTQPRQDKAPGMGRIQECAPDWISPPVWQPGSLAEPWT
jgi:hypothetical protein